MAKIADWRTKSDDELTQGALDAAAVREVRRDREQALVLEIAFSDITVTAKRKSVIALRAPNLIRIDSETSPPNAATLAQLIALTTGA